VSVHLEERDPQRFWIRVLDALRDTPAGSQVVRELTAAPDLDGWGIVERLLQDLSALRDRTWLVIDDVHELAADSLRQLELLVLRAPPQLRLVLATRQDIRLGLHRLRLEGELTEIRAADLRFTLEEARALLEGAGVRLPEPALALLQERTEGWAAGLRLAALSLSGHPDPEWFAGQFSGSERTVAEYLLAEVLERQDERVRRLLLHTSVLERVNGDLAEVLTGETGGERILQDLERAGAFVASLDPARSWFRYHRLFAELLQLELRRTAHGEIPALRGAAARWLAQHGYPAEAVRQAQAAQDWGMAARVLSDHWLGLALDGQAATAHQLLAGFPADLTAADPELTAVRAADELIQGSLDAAERHLACADQAAASVPAGRREHLRVLLAAARLFLTRQRGDLPAVAEHAGRLLALVDTPAADDARLLAAECEDLRATALIELGLSEMWAARFDQAAQHLEQGVALARRIGRPYLELTALASAAHLEGFRLSPIAEQRSRQAIELAERHGWSEEPIVAVAYHILAGLLVTRGRLEEAEPWLERAERLLRAEVEPAKAANIRYLRAILELARGRNADALAAFRAAERQTAILVVPHVIGMPMRAHMLLALVRLGETELVEAALARLDDRARESVEMRVALAALRLAQHDPRAATAALAPVLGGPSAGTHPAWIVMPLLLEANARDALGEAPAAQRALRRALDAAELQHVIHPFLLHPAPRLLERLARRDAAHAGLISEILGLLARQGAPGLAPPRPLVPLLDPLTNSEIRVLRYLPTHLTATEIACQLHLSMHTVTTHMRHVYAKLGVHRRREAVDRARALGLLASSPGGA
jgi:LuxR family maltose regulon positive regulatory protein